MLGTVQREWVRRRCANSVGSKGDQAAGSEAAREYARLALQLILEILDGEEFQARYLERGIRAHQSHLAVDL
ncbi:hypothetical protein RALTA_B0980 [Cupriavidus taiwanensis LMG 19424]|uniref:Uncharacterized protein n=1 Tax=Cupriavidus taiwanensis (strain DSM 17343 / BCRC 17206 / CCUG 44338 / CIP 107171 / LMG 19424 / R1) TaxID=977880 RepID=B3R9L6_CUPTR|nr:hypothetical protein RALTA_B0980 [Cupriavidus taiwanensis LMG 19424]